jgi:hypothetical protein
MRQSCRVGKSTFLPYAGSLVYGYAQYALFAIKYISGYPGAAFCRRETAQGFDPSTQQLRYPPAQPCGRASG